MEKEAYKETYRDPQFHITDILTTKTEPDINKCYCEATAIRTDFDGKERRSDLNYWIQIVNDGTMWVELLLN